MQLDLHYSLLIPRYIHCEMVLLTRESIFRKSDDIKIDMTLFGSEIGKIRENILQKASSLYI